MVKKVSSGKVLIIIPNLNGESCLSTCLSSIFELDYPKEEIKVVIVDNTSNDNSISLAEKQFPRVEIIKNKENLGFAKAVNLGIKKFKADYYLVTNNDVEFEKRSLEKLVELAENDEKIGIAGGKILGSRPSMEGAMPGIKLCPYLGFAQYHKRFDKIQECDWISGCAMLIKKKVIEKIGLFDEGYFFYFEDTDLCLRTKRAGFKLIFTPKALIWHNGGVSSKKIKKQEINLWWYRSKFRCLFKNANPLQIISSLFFQFFIFAPYKNLILKDKTFVPMIKGLWWAIKHR